MNYWEIFKAKYIGGWKYLGQMVTHPSWTNMFYWLIGLSLFVFLLEIIFPWRKNQKLIRKDFWLDTFYMFFNMFLYGAIGFSALSFITYKGFNELLAMIGINNLAAIKLQSLPDWAQLIIFFIIRDFSQWLVHVLLHRIPFLWKFHQVHHSVEEMGYAAHLRYHWMENIVYNLLTFLPLALLGISASNLFFIYVLTVLIGHLNHANIILPLGPLKYVLNNPQMHIWHHAKELPTKNGVNFGITLSLWDYIFKTAYIPKSGRDEPLGFDGIEEFPKNFIDQAKYPL